MCAVGGRQRAGFGRGQDGVGGAPSLVFPLRPGEADCHPVGRGHGTDLAHVEDVPWEDGEVADRVEAGHPPAELHQLSLLLARELLEAEPGPRRVDRPWDHRDGDVGVVPDPLAGAFGEGEQPAAMLQAAPHLRGLPESREPVAGEGNEVRRRFGHAVHTPHPRNRVHLTLEPEVVRPPEGRVHTLVDQPEQAG